MFEKLQLIYQSETESIIELAKLVAEDDIHFFRGACLDELDLRGENLIGFNFNEATFHNAVIDEETKYDKEFSGIISTQSISKTWLDECEFNPILFTKVDELDLSVRSANCLKNDNVVYLGDLVLKTEAEMLRTPNFGRKPLNEVKEVLSNMALHLGMDVKFWPPDNIEELSKRYEETTEFLQQKKEARIVTYIAKFDQKLFKKLKDLTLSTRIVNILNAHDIEYVGDLVQKSEVDILKINNLGRRSLFEMREIIDDLGLQFDIEFEDWPADIVAELSKRSKENLKSS